MRIFTTAAGDMELVIRHRYNIGVINITDWRLSIIRHGVALKMLRGPPYWSSDYLPQDPPQSQAQ